MADPRIARLRTQRPADIIFDLAKLGREYQQDPWRVRFVKFQLNGQQRADFYEELAEWSTRGGREVDERLTFIWQSYARRASGGYLQHPLATLLPILVREVTEGFSLAKALSRWVPPTEATALLAADRSGLDEERLTEIAKQTRQLAGGLRKIQSLVFQFYFQLAFMGGIMGYIGLVTVPVLLRFMPGGAPSGMAADLVWASDHIAWLAVGAVGLGLGVHAGLKTGLPRMTGPLRQMLDTWPVFSSYRAWSGYNWLMAMALLRKAGMGPVEAMTATLETATPYAAERIRAIAARRNLPLAEAMSKSGFEWPEAEAIRKLQLLTGGGHDDEQMQRIAQRWLDKLDGYLIVAGKWFEFASLIITVVITIWLSMAVANVQTGSFS